ncbi:DUF1127 domain-containing protein [Rhizobium multihospitium]|uniref:YjiS-like domain-containing protein n=1 Tax=Rhizobium multihospitium TaxID=410764 RepID=A0A1C3TW19_9HYPH|nr:DUF1127 domain-containing protein [Rhizobium multihospitium]SCB07409.1 protein of unknown function [Rhizobium multihospitium]
MQAANTLVSSQCVRSRDKARRSSLSRLLDLVHLLARKMAERRNRNSLLELSDDQLKDIGLSRGQNGSDVHVYSRY